jgi:hypothetical protein
MGEIADGFAEAVAVVVEIKKAGLRDREIRSAGRARTEEEGTIHFSHRMMVYPTVLLIGSPA